MSSSLERLRKILTLEQQRGYRDDAVIGGLEGFLLPWQEEARRNSHDAQLVEEVFSLLKGYNTFDQQRRREAIEKVLARICRGEAETSRYPKPNMLSRGTESSKALDSPVTALYGVSNVYAKRLKRLGVATIGDLLYLLPRRYEDFSALKTINQLRYGEEVTVVGNVWETQNRTTRREKVVTTSIIGDETGTIQCTWFNQPYLAKQLRPGRQVVISGKVDLYLGRLVFQSPEWEPLERELIHTGRLVPIYPLTRGLYPRWMRRLMKRVVDQVAKALPDPLPHELQHRRGLLDLPTAISQIHFPDDWTMLALACRRLSFDEFLLIQLGVLKQRKTWQAQPGQAIAIDEKLLGEMLSSLPFVLTEAQHRTLGEILHDLSEPFPMNRLLQGDVGSGKTVVAIIAMAMTVASGLQAALMAPTEILAEQHYATINEFVQTLEARGGALSGFHPTVRLLTGKLNKEERLEIHQEIEEGTADIIIGTHALIQEGARFHNLGLVVIDEQHRFGVSQRASLRQKGFNPKVLVMSATPIPRTLALTLYGDLDISTIDEFPPGRQRIITEWLAPRERERAYSFLHHQIAQGRQAFIICPLIEESEKISAKAATTEYERLQERIFPSLRLGLLHGRMGGEDKEKVMGKFRNGELDILVSTAVVEVGVDIPNATVMLVEGADRFGLAELHQFRGRVGRGEHQSYCLLLSDSPSIQGEHRLKVIESTQDGFKLAEEDLKMRGPGEFFGTQQSGLPELRLARLSDVKTLEEARQEALRIIALDMDLELPEHRLLAEGVEKFWRGEGDLS